MVKRSGITLCMPCHREWELAEMVTDIPFDQWLLLPSYDMLCTSFIAQGECSTSLSARDIHNAIEGSHRIAFMMRSSEQNAALRQIENIDQDDPARHISRFRVYRHMKTG